jgi:prepilin-type N-terminal cleavage/methylation domain-containing protein
MNSTARYRRGFTLIEVLVSATVLAVTLGSVTLSMRQGAASWQANLAAGSLDSKTELTLDRITRYLESASGKSLRPDLSATPFSSWVDFQETTGYRDGTRFLSEARRIELELGPGELDNGLDDNGNGLVDECRVVLIQDLDGDQIRVVIARGVRKYLQGESGNGRDDNGNGLIDEPGLSFDADGNTLNIRITLEKAGPTGDLLTRTLEGSITLLNLGK